MMTLRAGRLTPDERVEVAARTLIMPWRKAPSNTSRSSNVNPAESNINSYKHTQKNIAFSLEQWFSNCVAGPNQVTNKKLN